MDLKMNYNSFIKLKDFFKVVDISAEIDEYEAKDNIIDGVLHIKGKYLRRDNVSEEYFLEKIPFSILMTCDDFEIEDINCIDFEYVAIDGRGIDVNFDISINYLVYEEVPVVIDTNDDMVFLEERPKNEETNDLDQKSTSKEDETVPQIDETDKIEAVKLEDDEFEMLKNEETNRIDKLLKSTLSYKDDNLPTSEIVIRGLPEEKSTVKVYYYKKESELEKVCSDNQLSLDSVFKKNQKYEFNKYHRVIVNDK